MKFKLLGTEIYISFLFMALVSFMLATDRTGYIIPTAMAVILHEAGHLFAMWLFECSPKSIKLIPTSIEIVRGFSKKPYGETVIAIMGPLVNLFLSLVFYLNYIYLQQQWLLVFSFLNLIIGVFNLLPVKGLDGGTIVFNTASRFFGDYIAARTVSILTLAAGFSLLTLGVFILLNGSVNLSVFIIALYLIISVIVKL